MAFVFRAFEGRLGHCGSVRAHGVRPNGAGDPDALRSMGRLQLWRLARQCCGANALEPKFARLLNVHVVASVTEGLCALGCWARCTALNYLDSKQTCSGAEPS